MLEPILEPVFDEHSTSPLTQQHERIRDSAVYAEFFNSGVRSQHLNTTITPPGETQAMSLMEIEKARKQLRL